MSSSRLYRINGLGVVVGAAAFVIHVVLRSLMTAGVDPAVVAKQSLWVPTNALGVLGAALVLLGLPALYARVAGPPGLLGLVGVVLVAAAWMFFGLFLSLYATLVGRIRDSHLLRSDVKARHDKMVDLVETTLKLHVRLSRMSLVRCSRTPVVHPYPNVLDCRQSCRIIKET